MFFSHFFKLILKLFFLRKKVSTKLSKGETPIFFVIVQATKNGVLTLWMSSNKHV